MKRPQPFPQGWGKPILTVFFGTAFHDTIKILIRPEFIPGKEAPYGFSHMEVREKEDGPLKMELGEQEKGRPFFAGFCFHGHD
jgi:hypothetical protein